MWLVSELTAAEWDDPQPGMLVASRIEADHLGEPFKLGALLIMQVLEPDAEVSIGTRWQRRYHCSHARRVARSLDSRSVLRRWRFTPLRPGPSPMASASSNHGSITLTAQLAPVSVPGLFFASESPTGPAVKTW